MIRPSLVFVLILTGVPGFASAQDTGSSPPLSSLACPIETGPPAKTPHTWIAVSTGLMAQYRVGGKDPKYPSGARKAHVEGCVELKVTVSESGKVEDVCILGGPEMLQQAAYDAVKTWKYKPFLVNGQPKKVKTQANIDFTLSR